MRARDALFRTKKSETKADSTARISREITEAETSARELKSQSLRAARLERETAKKTQEANNLQRKPQRSARSKAPAGN